jgi:hypothetical protein
MNLIFHDLLGIILEVYIDDLVIKSAGFDCHVAGFKMNPLKCAFSASVGRFLGFVVHEKRIEIDPKKIESITRLGRPECKRDVQNLLGK